MKRTRILTSFLILILLWQLKAAAMANDFILPYPLEVLSTMGKQLHSPAFFDAVMHTLLRSCLGLLLAFLLAFVTSYLSFQFTIFKDLFYPILLLTRSVPNISYTIIVLLWFGSDTSALIVSFLIIFPTIYSNLYSGFHHMAPSLKKVIQLYPESKGYLMRRVYLPSLQGAIQASLSSGFSLAFKVGVMAEIVGQVQIGIGRQLNICRLNADMSGIFAWTGWIILVLICLDMFLRLIYHKKRLPNI